MDTSVALHKKIPTQAGSAAILAITTMRNDMVGYLMRMEKVHGPVWRTPMGLGGAIISMLGPDALEFVLKNRDSAFSNARGWFPFIGRVFPGAIMAMDGDEHRYQRRIMQVAFRKSALRTYLEQMAPAIDFGIGAWLEPHDRSATRQMYPLLKQLTLDLAASVFMGVELGRDAKDLNKAFVATVAASLAFFRFAVPGLKMWRGVRGREVLVNRFRALMPEKRAERTGRAVHGSRNHRSHDFSHDGGARHHQQLVDHDDVSAGAASGMAGASARRVHGIGQEATRAR
jgi:cytochrome P450